MSELVTNEVEVPFTAKRVSYESVKGNGKPDFWVLQYKVDLPDHLVKRQSSGDNRRHRCRVGHVGICKDVS